MERLGIRKIKLSGTVLTWSAYFLAEDEFGRWSFTPPGSTVHNRKGDEEWTATIGVGTEAGFLWLMPRDEWFYAGWWRRPDWEQLAVDACTIPSLTDGLWTWTDLELDVCRDATGKVWVEDEDEFDESLAAGFIDTASEAAARNVTDTIVTRLTDRIAPFDGTGWARHDEAVTLELAPLEPPPV